jgi:hypothetical protein
MSAFSRARAQSAYADRARNRMGFFEHDYEQEHEHENASFSWWMAPKSGTKVCQILGP